MILYFFKELINWKYLSASFIYTPETDDTFTSFIYGRLRIIDSMIVMNLSFDEIVGALDEDMKSQLESLVHPK